MTNLTLIRRCAGTFSAILALACTAIGAQAAETVEMNKTHLLRLPGPAAAIVIGNPKIADVTVHSDNTLFVMGRGFGQTDILILDANGGVLMHTDINVVAAATPNRVSVISPGMGRVSYDCAPYCYPAPVPGDDPSHVEKYQSTVASAPSGTALISAPVDSGDDLSGGPYGGGEQPRIQSAESDFKSGSRNMQREQSTRSFQSNSQPEPYVKARRN